jgi:antitoxin MazE
MKVAKWGNALAIRLPIAVVKELGLKEGDQVDIRVSGERAFVVAREPRPIESPAAARLQVPPHEADER